MATRAHRWPNLPNLPTSLASALAPRPVSRLVLLLAALALAGLGLALLSALFPQKADAPPATQAPPPPLSWQSGGLARGDIGIPIVGDFLTDMTIWYSDGLSSANRAALENLRGQQLTPTDPLANEWIKDLYAKILLVTIPLLTLGGLLLGYLVMLSRTSGESAYTVRAVTPRFITGTTLSIMGIFLVSILAQLVITTDQAMVGIAVGADSLGGPANWPAGGGVFAVLQNAGFNPRQPEGPDNWNTAAWLGVGVLATVLMTILLMINASLSGLERLLVLVGPLCLAAYAIPATQGVTNLWLKTLGAILMVRFGWSVIFALFSREAQSHLGETGVPPTAADTNVLLGLATGAAFLMLIVPAALFFLMPHVSGPMRTER
jgi:hypothetical protein